MVLHFRDYVVEAQFENHLARVKASTDSRVLCLCWVAKILSTFNQLKADFPFGSPPFGILPNIVLFSLEIFGYWMHKTEARRSRWLHFRENWFSLWGFLHGGLVILNHKAVLSRLAASEDFAGSKGQLKQLIFCFIWASNILWVLVFMLFSAPRCSRVMYVHYPVLLLVMLPTGWLYPTGLDHNVWLLHCTETLSSLPLRRWFNLPNVISPKACFVAACWVTQSFVWWMCYLKQYLSEFSERKAYAAARRLPTSPPWLDSQPDIVAVLFVQHALITAALRVSFPTPPAFLTSTVHS